MALHRRREPVGRTGPHPAKRCLGAAVAGALTAGVITDVTSATTPGVGRSSTVAPDAALSVVAPSPLVERHAFASEGTGAIGSTRAETHVAAAVDNLVKASVIADRAAAYAATLRAARADGAPDVSVYGGVAFAGPTVGRLTSATGPRWGTRHEGLDIANRIGTPVYAVADGVVVDSGPVGGFGMWVRVRHADGWTSVYGHIDRALVRVGQRVNAGKRIAMMGNRGRSTGPHLHIEIWDAEGRKVDPFAWLAARGVRTPPP